MSSPTNGLVMFCSNNVRRFYSKNIILIKSNCVFSSNLKLYLRLILHYLGVLCFFFCKNKALASSLRRC